MWDSAKYMAFDFETSGTLPEYALQPWRIAAGDTWATSLATVRRVNGAAQVGGGLCVGAGALPPKHYIQDMLQQAVDEQITLVAWNALFDISILIGYGFQDMVFQCKFLDAMLLWKHVHTFPEYDTARDKKFHYGLKAAVAQYIPAHAGYEADVDFHSTDPNDLKRLHNYNVLDSALTLRLAQMFYTQLAAEPPRLKAAQIEAQCLPLVAWANWHGIPMDRAALATLGNDLTTEAAAALVELAPHGITEKIVRSPKQLSKVMFEDWGLPVLKQNTSKKTGKTTDSTDKEVLHELSFIDPRAKYLRQYREALGNKTKFVDAPETSAEYNGDGKSHPLAIVFSTYTGRVTYVSKQGKNKDERQIGFALHQEKREERFRDIATPPEGYTLVEFDAAGQEYRWMAIASGDPAMQHLCMEGEDAHTYMGAQIARRDYTELRAAYAAKDKDAGSARQLGKVANLSCVAEGTLILSSRGLVSVECLPSDALVWDGSAWVRHGGAILQGLREVITYAGLTATSDHLVLVESVWVRFDQAARHGWAIEPAMGTGWACTTRTKVRVMGGLVYYGFSEVWRAICALPLWLRLREGLKSSAGRDRAHTRVRDVQQQAHPQEPGASSSGHTSEASLAETCVRDVPEMQQSQRPIIHKLWWAGSTLLIYVGKVLRRVGTGKSAARRLQKSGLRPHRQQQSLRPWQPATGLQTTELAQHSPQRICTVARTKNLARGVERKPILNALCRTVRSCWAVWRGNYSTSLGSSSRKAQRLENITATARVYDILDCGPNNRFAANGLIVHNCGYRTSAGKLRVVARVNYNLPMELPEATHIRETYLRTYPNVPKYWSRQIERVKRLGYAETFAGRRVQVQGSWSGDGAWSRESTAINYPIQGTGADQKYLALSVLRGYIVKHGIYFAWELHDGLYFYVPTKIVDKVIPEMRYLLNNLPYKKAWGFEPPIPLPWDCKASDKSWGQLKEVKV